MVRRTVPAAVVLTAVVGLAVSSCTRPVDTPSADASIAPVTDTSDPDGSDDGSADDPSVRDPTTTTTSTTIADGATTSTTDDSRPTTTTTTTSTTPTTSTRPAEPPDDLSDLTLIFDGILPFRFGDRDVDVVPGLSGLLGAPTQDDLREYPVADQGVFLDPDGEESFVARFGRTVCYANGLCVQFGAGAPETLIFTGWRVGDASSGLTTDDGLSIGATLAEFADLITFDPASGCFQVVDGTAAGIDVTLLSDDGAFATPAPDGDGLVVGDPDPAAVTVIELRAGQLPVATFADC